MKTLVTLIVLSVSITLAFGQKNRYAVEDIPAELKKESNAVLRAYDISFKVKGKSEATTKVRRVVTILNEHGKSHGYVDLFYDKFTKVKEIKTRIYNKDGKIIRRALRTDYADFPAIANFSLYEDNRVMYYYPEYTSYPYTLEVEYEIANKSLLNTPRWKPQYSRDLAVEHSTFTLSYPETTTIRYKAHNVEVPFSETADHEGGSSISLEWSVQNLRSKKSMESSGDSIRSPMVLTSPETISMDGHESPNDSWADFGQWFYDLNRGRDNLAGGRIGEIERLTADLPTDKEKVKAVYELLQSGTRYVNISLGIGGYQSFPAGVVDKVGYGDCKALTTYTKAMLNAIGIPSNHVLVKAGRDPVAVEDDFPSNQFNHVILAVPHKEDTTWLECTSQQIPFGFLGSFTNDRKALWIGDGASKLITTPVYNADHNREQRSIELLVDEDGSAKMAISVLFAGLRSELGGLSYIVKKSPKDQRDWINQYLNLPGMELLEYRLEEKDTPEVTLYAEVDISQFAQKQGNDLILKLPPIAAFFTGKGVVGKYEFLKSDSIALKFGESLASGLVSNKNVTSDFGDYHMQINPDDRNGGLIITRSFLSKKSKGADSEELKKFYKQIIRNDQRVIILKSKT